MVFVRFRESYRLLENINDENVESFPIRKMKRIFSACGQWRQSKINLYHSQTCILQHLIVLPSISLLSLQPTYCSTSGLPVLHNFPEFAQICVHWVGDAIQPSQPLLLSPQHFTALLLNGPLTHAICKNQLPEDYRAKCERQNYKLSEENKRDLCEKKKKKEVKTSFFFFFALSSV